MLEIISMEDIKRDFDGAMRKAGYVRAAAKCKEWGITVRRLSALIRRGFKYDTFVVNGVRYIHADSRMAGIQEKASDKIWPIDYM